MNTTEETNSSPRYYCCTACSTINAGGDSCPVCGAKSIPFISGFPFYLRHELRTVVRERLDEEVSQMVEDLLDPGSSDKVFKHLSFLSGLIEDFDRSDKAVMSGSTVLSLHPESMDSFRDLLRGLCLTLFRKV